MKSHFLQFGILFAICLLTLQKGQAQLPDGTTGTQDLLQFLASFGFVCLD